MIAITGTDGKTTTVGMLVHILLRSGKTVGAASTAFMQINEEKIENDTHLTSLSREALHSFLKKLVDEGCQYAIVEMSSHGLVQGRGHYIWPKISAITNISHEHLDYHGSMANYIRDKGIIFRILRRSGTKVLNGSDESFAVYQKIKSKNTIVYNSHSGDLFTSEQWATPTNVKATLHTATANLSLVLNMPGVYNLENAQCAIACAMSLGISAEDAVKALEDFQSMPGRMEKIDEGQNFSVYVDFAMTANGYEKALRALREIVGNDQRVLVLGSCCGDRDAIKRPDIGRVCSEHADVVVISEDETYGEDPRKVQDEVWAGVDQSKTDAHKIFNRTEAITFLFKEAQPGDAVILCGMGPFSTMNRLDGPVEWDERSVAREILKSM